MLIHNLKNGINERNHGSIDVKVQKIVSKDKSMTLEDVVSMAGWTHSMNANTSGHELFAGIMNSLPDMTST